MDRSRELQEHQTDSGGKITKTGGVGETTTYFGLAQGYDILLRAH